MRVYIAYGTATDARIAMRLQVLSGDHMDVYVRPAGTRDGEHVELDELSAAALRESDLVVGLIGAGVSEACRQELGLSNELGKTTVVIVEPASASQLKQHYARNVVIVNPADPARAELGIVNFLKKVDVSAEMKKTVVAVGTVALGLVLLSRNSVIKSPHTIPDDETGAAT